MPGLGSNTGTARRSAGAPLINVAWPVPCRPARGSPPGSPRPRHPRSRRPPPKRARPPNRDTMPPRSAGDRLADLRPRAPALPIPAIRLDRQRREGFDIGDRAPEIARGSSSSIVHSHSTANSAISRSRRKATDGAGPSSRKAATPTIAAGTEPAGKKAAAETSWGEARARLIACAAAAGSIPHSTTVTTCSGRGSTLTVTSSSAAKVP